MFVGHRIRLLTAVTLSAQSRAISQTEIRASRITLPLARRCLATTPSEKPTEAEEKQAPSKNLKDQHKELSYRLLDRDNKIDDLAELVLATPEESFNNVNTSVGLYRLGRLLSNAPDEPTWERTKAAQKLLTMATKHSYDPLSCANMCFGAAVARVDGLDAGLATGFLHHIVSDQNEKVPSYTPKQLTVVGWSFAMLQTKEDAFLKRIFAEASDRSLKDFDLKDLPKILFAMGRSQVKDGALINKITKFLITVDLAAMEPNDLSGLVWSLGRLGHKDEELLKRVSDEVMVRRKGFEEAGFSLQSMSRFMWGLAAIPYKDENLIKNVLDITARRSRFLRDQSRKDLSYAMWAFGVKDFEEQLAKADAASAAKSQKREEIAKKRAAALERKVEALAAKRKAEEDGDEKSGPTQVSPTTG